jgi:hypothetical protein
MWSAIVQAGSAAVIVVLTIFLVRFTGGYVDEMRRSNELQEQANAISSALVGRAARQDAPFLVATPAGGEGTTGGAGVSRLRVQNRGGGLAHQITLETTWGDGHLESLADGETQDVPFHKETGYGAGEPLRSIRFRFRDAAGAEWVQESGKLPTQT